MDKLIKIFCRDQDLQLMTFALLLIIILYILLIGFDKNKQT